MLPKKRNRATGTLHFAYMAVLQLQMGVHVDRGGQEHAVGTVSGHRITNCVSDNKCVFEYI